MRFLRIHSAAAALALAALTSLVAAGCGEKDEPAIGTAEVPPSASSFPATGGGTLDDVLAKSEPADDLVVAPANKDFTVGRNRFAVGVFTVDGGQVGDADIAIYVAHGPDGKAEGPFPARAESLATDPAFTSQTTSTDPDAAKTVYVTDVQLDKPGEWRAIALIRRDGAYSGTRVTSLVAKSNDPIPAVGEKAPIIHTPTVDDVGDVSEIDTRVPPDTMHEVDFADVVGKQPIVLVFATPALCQSRVCGPVVDIAEQVKRDRPDDAAYIHMEIYSQNDPSKPIRPQFATYQPVAHPTEPWLFVIGSDGKISSRIEGAFSAPELEDALDRVK